MKLSRFSLNSILIAMVAFSASINVFIVFPAKLQANSSESDSVREDIVSKPSQKINNLWSRNAQNAGYVKHIKPEESNDTPLGFALENLNLTVPASCGAQKCFFREKGEHPRFGYLVVKSQEPLSYHIAKGKKAWDLAQMVEKKHSASILFGPVEPVELREHDAIEMNKVLMRAGTMIEEGYYSKGVTAVYSVRVGPEPSLLFGVSKNKYKKATDHLRELVSSSSDGESFLLNFMQEINKTLVLLKDVTCLVNDFQVLLDSLGNMWHLDFDRCLTRSGPPFDLKSEAFFPAYSLERVKTCFDNYVELAQRIVANSSSMS